MMIAKAAATCWREQLLLDTCELAIAEIELGKSVCLLRRPLECARSSLCPCSLRRCVRGRRTTNGLSSDNDTAHTSQ